MDGTAKTEFKVKAVYKDKTWRSDLNFRVYAKNHNEANSLAYKEIRKMLSVGRLTKKKCHVIISMVGKKGLTMEESYLIQRLEKPLRQTDGKVVANPFSFGGGLVNGGLTKEAMALIGKIFTFDYMGAAEFEWGAVPEALQKIAKNTSDYIAFKQQIKFHYKKTFLKKGNDVRGSQTIFIICRKEWKEEVVKRISTKAKGDFGKRKDNFTTKVYVGLDFALGGTDIYDKRIKGWLELDNGYFFFTDKEMFNNTRELFGIREES